MDKRDVIEFFDRLAPAWDDMQEDRDAVISVILDNAGVSAGQDVLDVACGTGVLFPHYLNRGVRALTGIDISPEMARLAARKYADNPL
ncbi:MAG: methyltransferase domain-containing protein, partial [Clostridia bacterium]|nr:methyltransferase domain-containing protein [Clostridia bacterium]